MLFGVRLQLEPRGFLGTKSYDVDSQYVARFWTWLGKADGSGAFLFTKEIMGAGFMVAVKEMWMGISPDTGDIIEGIICIKDCPA